MNKKVIKHPNGDFEVSNVSMTNLIKKYNLKTKSLEELEKLIGDSDRGCMTIAECDFLKGSDFIIKARNLHKYLNKS